MFISWVFTNCSNTRYLQQGEVLLHKNTINVETENKFVKKLLNKRSFQKELEILYRQKPNKKALGLIKLKLWIFNKANQKRENHWRWWLKNKIGESPALYDSVAADKTARMMRNYLYNKGYFYANVRPSALVQNKRAHVTYHVIPKSLYTIRQIYFPEAGDEPGKIIHQNQKNTFLHPSSPFDLDLLKAERERIAYDFKNEGYFTFNKEFVHFDIDSSEEKKELDVYVKIHHPAGQATYPVYYIHDVYIFTQYAGENKEQLPTDTIKINDYIFIGPALRYQPKILLDDIFLKKGARYSMKNYQLTINRLADIGIFKFVDILFKPYSTDSTNNLLDCLIYLIPSKKQEITSEIEISTGSESYFGTALKFTYKNRNLLNRSDIFVWNLNGGIESQLFKDSKFLGDLDSIVRNVDFSTQFNFYLSEFLGPKWWGFSQQFNPKTRISASYHLLQRVDLYQQNSISFLFGYDWKEFTFKRHLLNPINISFVLFTKETAKFKENLERYPWLKNSFIDQVIVGTNYTFIFNNQEVNKIKDFVFFKFNADLAGLTLRVARGLADGGNSASSVPYTIGGINFAQYLRSEIDVRHYKVFDDYTTWVTRLNIGWGIAYWNSSVLPYIKQFYAGGTNSIRAWKVRELGPGSYVDPAKNDPSYFPDQTGDIKLEANMELRFKIFEILKGALFVDGGNIWTSRKEQGRTGAQLGKDFYKEIALGTGFGTRFDFTFFILRLDFAFKLRDPSLPESQRWTLQKLDITSKSARKEMTINLAIGYPF